MDGYTLPPDLEQFAAEAVATGRYRDVDDVVRAGLDLVKRQEAARATLIASVLDAETDADRRGCLTGEQVSEHVRATITQKAARTS